MLIKMIIMGFHSPIYAAHTFGGVFHFNIAARLGRQSRDGSYSRLRETGRALQQMQSRALEGAGIAHQICGDETLFDVFFTTGPCRDYRSAKHDDPARNATYNATLRQHGIFKSPGKLYPSLAITPVDLEKTEYAIERAVQSIALT